MSLLSAAEKVALRVLNEMNDQGVGFVELASRLGWSQQMVACRLGLVLPLGPDQLRLGGRVPLTERELVAIASALKLPAATFGARELAEQAA